MGLYTIYDRVAEQCGPVFQAVNDGIASRNFCQLIDEKASYPEDYDLIYLGSIDLKTMLIQSGPPITVSVQRRGRTIDHE